MRELLVFLVSRLPGWPWFDTILGHLCLGHLLCVCLPLPIFPLPVFAFKLAVSTGAGLGHFGVGEFCGLRSPLKAVLSSRSSAALLARLLDLASTWAWEVLWPGVWMISWALEMSVIGKAIVVAAGREAPGAWWKICGSAGRGGAPKNVALAVAEGGALRPRVWWRVIVAAKSRAPGAWGKEVLMCTGVIWAVGTVKLNY